MENKSLIFRIKKKLIGFTIKSIQFFRIKKYQFLSICEIEGKPKLNQPVLFSGNGRIVFKGNVNIGVIQSPFFLNSYGRFEARKRESIIFIEEGVWLNNNASICSDGAGIYIGKNTVAGVNLSIIDSDFHNLDPDKRMGNYPYKIKSVHILENVFIGSNVSILKGVTIGKNSIIANGSVVTKSIPENVIAGGNPAKVIKNIM